MSEIKILEQVASIKILCEELERHLKAGAIHKANNDADNIVTASQGLFNMTYDHAYTQPPLRVYVTLAELKELIRKDSSWEGFEDSVAWQAIRGASSVQQIVAHLIGAQMVKDIEEGTKLVNRLSEEEWVRKDFKRQNDQTDAAEHSQHVE